MGPRGYPLLLASGETADGVNHLVDRQHPHDLFMELAATYSHPLTDDATVFFYGGLPGEPAFGPPAFMHRASSADSPEAPISHHWLDSTHITFGVLTAGVVAGRWKLDASAFRGREPDQHRYDIEGPRLDSVSARLSFNPSQEWALQASWAKLSSPEALDPNQDEERVSVSAIYTRRFGASGAWNSTAAWGRKMLRPGPVLDAWLLESAVAPNKNWTFFGRAERVETAELAPGIHTVGKLSLGAIRDLAVTEHIRIGIGALTSAYAIPKALKTGYADPKSAMLFLRLKVG
jgi:hypothetical protein